MVTFADSKIIDEAEIQELGQELYDLVERDDRKKIVLNFANVEFLSSAALGKLIGFDKRVKQHGAQLCAADGTLIDRDYARAWLPHHLEGGQDVDLAIEVPAPERAGRYQLKFDLVCEGIDWFETSGSPTTSKSLLVV